MVLVVYCASCGSKLNAKEELRGQTRKCPKCGQPVLIDDKPTEPVSQYKQTGGITQTQLTGPTIEDEHIEKPSRLDFANRYFIVGYDRLIAVWEAGKGWRVNVGAGFALAKQNVGAIPDQGTFTLVELLVDEARNPVDMRLYKITKRGALTALYRDESEVLNSIEGIGSLSKAQKAVLVSYMRKNFMQSFFDSEPRIMQYLTNAAITESGFPPK